MENGMFTLSTIHNQFYLMAMATDIGIWYQMYAGVSINESTTDLIIPAATGNLVGAWVAVLEQGTQQDWSHSICNSSEGSCLRR